MRLLFLLNCAGCVHCRRGWGCIFEVGHHCYILCLWLSPRASFPHQVVLIRAPLNDWMCYNHRVHFKQLARPDTRWQPLSELTEWGNTPSVSHIGSNWMRACTITMSRMKMLLKSGELCHLCCVTLSCRSADKERVNAELNTGGGEAEAAVTPESLLCCL